MHALSLWKPLIDLIYLGSLCGSFGFVFWSIVRPEIDKNGIKQVLWESHSYMPLLGQAKLQEVVRPNEIFDI